MRNWFSEISANLCIEELSFVSNGFSSRVLTFTESVIESPVALCKDEVVKSRPTSATSNYSPNGNSDASISGMRDLSINDLFDLFVFHKLSSFSMIGLHSRFSGPLRSFNASHQPAPYQRSTSRIDKLRQRVLSLKRDPDGSFNCILCHHRMPTAFLSSISLDKCRICYESHNRRNAQNRRSNRVYFWKLLTDSIPFPTPNIVSVILSFHFESCVRDPMLKAKRLVLHEQTNVGLLPLQSEYSLRVLLFSSSYASSPSLLRSWLFFQNVLETPPFLPSTYANRSDHTRAWSLDHSVPRILIALDLRVFCQIHLMTSLCPLLVKVNSIKSTHIVPGKLFYQSVKFASAVIYWIILSVCPQFDLSHLSVEDSVRGLIQLSSSPLSSLNSQSVSAFHFVQSFACKPIPSDICQSMHVKESTAELVSAAVPTGHLSFDIIQLISDLGLPTSWAAAHWHQQRSVAFVGPAVMALAAALAEAIASSAAPSSSSCSSSHFQFVLQLPEVLFDDAASIGAFLRSRSPCDSLEAALDQVSCPLRLLISDLLDPVDVATHQWIPSAIKHLLDFFGPTRVDIGTKALLLRLAPWIRTELVPHARELNQRHRDRLSSMVYLIYARFDYDAPSLMYSFWPLISPLACLSAALSIRLPSESSSPHSANRRESASSSASKLSPPAKVYLQV